MHILYQRLCVAITLAILILTPFSAFGQSTFAWSGGSGNWDESSKWIPTGVPGPGDIAILQTGTITLTADTEVGTLNLNGGTLFGGHKFTITNLLSWTDGRFSGNSTEDSTIVAAGATIQITGDGNKEVNSRTVVFRGDGQWEGIGKIRLLGGAILANDAGSTFEIRNDAQVDFSSPGGGTFANYGTLTKTASLSETTIEAIFENYGTLNVLTGTLKFIGGSSNTGGVFAVGGGTTILFSGDTHVFDGASFSGLGNFENSDGVFQAVGGGLTVNQGPIFKMVGSNSQFEGDGPIVINGVFDWGRSTITGSGDFIVNGEMRITGNSSKRLDGRVITNNGDIIWQGDGSVRFLNNSQIKNNSDGVFDIRNNALLDFNDPDGGTINNSGTIVKSAGSGSTTFDIELTSSGTVELDSGTVRFTRGSTFNSGAFNLNDAATLQFEEGDHNFSEGASLNVSGTIMVKDGETNFSGNINGVGPMFIENGIFNFNSNSAFTDLTQTGGVLGGDGHITVNGDYIWQKGTITGNGGITVNQVLDMSGQEGDIKVLDGQSLTNAGTANWTSLGDIRLANGAVFLNQSGGQFFIETDANIDIDFGAESGGTVQNAGIMTKRNSNGITQLGVFLQNSGNLNINSGTLRVLNSSSIIDGVLNIAAGSMVEISDGNHSWENATFSGQGQIVADELQITVEGDPGLIIGPDMEMSFRGSSSNWDGSGSIINNGALNWDRGRIRGDGGFLNNNRLSIGGDNFKVLDGRTITNNSEVFWIGGGAFRMVNAAQFINSENGTIDIQNNAILSYIDPLGGSIRNEGKVVKNNSDANSIIEVDFFNGGELDIQTGQISFLRFLANEPSGSLSGSGTLDVSEALFLNDGTVNPGSSPGTLSITGNYPQSGGARLNIELGGTTPDTEYDRIVATGNAQLGGTLNIALTNGFVPEANQSFEIISAASRVGEFSEIIGLNGGVFDIEYTDTGVILNNFNFPPNQPPIAQDDLILSTEDNVSIMQILNNDSDPDGNPLTINSFTQPRNGEVVQTTATRLMYTPVPDFFGRDTLFYVISDGFGGTDQARVIINVISVNDLPDVFPEMPDLSFLSSDSLTLDLNDFAIDLENEPLEMSWDTEILSAANEKVDPSDLQIDIDAQNIATFTATSDSFGVFVVKFILSDADGGTALDTIGVSVRTAPPVIVSPIENGVYDEDSGPLVIAADLNTVFQDPEGSDDLVFSATSDNPQIIPSISENALVVDTDEHYYGSGTITVTAVDPSGATGSDIFNLEFTPVNDIPQFENLPDTLWFWKDSLATINIWEFVDDPETSDTMLTYEFTTTNDSLERNFDDETGLLTLTSKSGFYGKVFMGIHATDAEEAVGSDTIEVFVGFTSGLDDPINNAIPVEFALEQNYPNPFNPETKIRFQLPVSSEVKLTVYNILGQRVRTLISQRMPLGHFEISWDGRNDSGVQMTSGVYVYRISAVGISGEGASFQEMKKMILLR